MALRRVALYHILFGKKPKSLIALTMTAMVTYIMVTGTFIQFALGALGPTLRSNVHGFNASSLGELTAVLFGSACLGSLVYRRLADLAPLAWVTLFQILVAVVPVVLLCVAETEGTLFGAAVIGGMAMAVGTPLTNRIIVRHVNLYQQPSTVAWRSLGPQWAGVIAGVGYGLVADASSWKVLTLFGCGLVLLLGIASALVLARLGDPLWQTVGAEPQMKGMRHHRGAPRRQRQNASAPVLMLAGYAFFASGSGSAIAAFLPVYGVESVGLSRGMAVLSGGLISAFALVGRVGWVRTFQGWSYARLMAIASLSGAMGMVAIGPLSQVWVAFFWLGVAVTGTCALGATAMTQVELLRRVPPEKVGQSSTIMGVGLYGGFAVQPITFGYIHQDAGYGLAWSSLAVAGLLASALILKLGAPAETGRVNGSQAQVTVEVTQH